MLLRYAIVGVIKVPADFLVFNAVLIGAAAPSTGHLLLAATAGFTSGAAVTYVLNARYTFRAPAGFDSLGRYVAVSAGGLLLHNAALLVLAALIAPSGVLALNTVKVGALLASLAWNYIGYSRLVFAHPPRPLQEGIE
ncbi:MAG: GtrA family protein [Chloroflexi bacterium]|nr:GtrA family protein [Chloroflexota bacterium]